MPHDHDAILCHEHEHVWRHVGMEDLKRTPFSSPCRQRCHFMYCNESEPTHGRSSSAVKRSLFLLPAAPSRARLPCGLLYELAIVAEQTPYVRLVASSILAFSTLFDGQALCDTSEDCASRAQSSHRSRSATPAAVSAAATPAQGWARTPENSC